MKKKTYSQKMSTLKCACDKLWAKIIKGSQEYQCQAGELLNESCSNIMNAHHIENRGLSVRWELDNGLCLCQKHHTMGMVSAHSTSSSGQREFASRVMVEVCGVETLEALKFKRNQIKKWNLSELEELKERLTKALQLLER